MDFGQRIMEATSGSMVSFKQRSRETRREERDGPETVAAWQRDKLAVSVLRQFRAVAFEAATEEQRQTFLEEARAFADQFADNVIRERLNEPSEAESLAFGEHARQVAGEFGSLGADTKYSTPPSTVVSNLRRATEDMLARIDAMVGSAEHPSRKLSEPEMREALREFLTGTNLLYAPQLKNLFGADVRVGGVLTGGLVYTLIAKKIVDRFGERPSGWRPFAIALDAKAERGVCERGVGDTEAEVAYVFDDMISKGGSVRTATEVAGEHFPLATVYSGTGTSTPEGRRRQREERAKSHLSGLFYDFADAYEEERDPAKARRLFREAAAYAQTQGIELSRGFVIRMAKIDAEFGPEATK